MLAERRTHKDKQTNRHAHHNTALPYRRWSKIPGYASFPEVYRMISPTERETVVLVYNSKHK